MDFKIEITPYAKLQLLDILEFYLEKGAIGRMNKVESSILNAIAQIQRYPFSNKAYENVNQPNANLRRCMVKNINLILYEIKGDSITILDIFDCRRNPESVEY